MTLRRTDVPALYAITDPARGTHAHLARTFWTAGIRWIQIREKEMADRSLFEELGRVMADVPRDVSIFVNDRADLALASGASGVHVGDEDLTPASIRKAAAGRPLCIGYSTHSAAEAEIAAADPEVDYVALGPIFRSSTKDVREPRGLDLIRAVRSVTGKPLVAIGGITVENIASVIAAGADSAAVIAALYTGGAIEENVAALIEEAESAR